VAAFDSQATNLVGGDNNGVVDLFVHDRTTARTTVVSVSTRAGSEPARASGRRSAPVGDSSHSNRLPRPSWRPTRTRRVTSSSDRLTRETTRVSVGPGGVQGNATSFDASISADGRFVAFISDASNLIPGGSTNRQAFVRDRQTGVTELVSVDSVDSVDQRRRPLGCVRLVREQLGPRATRTV
jgi:hypothetical protein